jgi:hypothetical protein
MPLFPRVLLPFVFVLSIATAVAAQSPPSTPPAAPQGEEVEPRVIGMAGTTFVGAGGSLDHVYSSTRFLPVNYTIEADVTRFLSPAFAVRGGLIGSGSRGGDEADEIPTGTGAPAVHAHGGLFYYFTPRSMWSLYSGLGYWTQLTRREPSDRGTAVVSVGLEGAASSRVHLFGEGAYGMGLSRGDERTNRLVVYAGIRIRLR